MKLTIKHLSAYSPYGLKFFGENGFTELCMIDFNKNQIKLSDKLGNAETASLLHNKPILKPLSDYFNFNGKAMDDLNIEVNIELDISELAAKRISLSDIKYPAYLVMVENHIDFQNLIPQGLAIDKTTLPL